MNFQVLIENLSGAATELRTAVKPLEGYSLDSSNVNGVTFGHVELAAWFDAVVEQCDRAGQALHDGAEVLAGSLDNAVLVYRDADETGSLQFYDYIYALES